jgi:hypothetical protein
MNPWWQIFAADCVDSGSKRLLASNVLCIEQDNNQK